MSVCLEPSAVLPSSSTATESELLERGPIVSSPKLQEKGTQDVTSTATQPSVPLPSTPPPQPSQPQPQPQSQNLTKLVLTNTLTPTSCNTTPVLQKVSNSSVITVVNATGPLTILKTLCSNPCVTSASQFTLVNSAPLNVCNAVGKPITVVGAPPITVVRAISSINPPLPTPQTPAAVLQTTDESTKTTETVTNSNVSTSSSSSSPSSSSSVNGSSAERSPIHNVFVKNTSIPPDLIPSNNEVTQVQKIVPANSFIQNNVIQTVSSTSGSASKSINGQKATIPGSSSTATNNKLKIVSNVIVSASTTNTGSSNITNNNNNNSPSNIILNKSATPKHYMHQQKMINSSLNGTPKFVNKTSTLANSFVKASTSAGSNSNNNSSSSTSKNLSSTSKTQKLLYPTHKSQIRTIPPVNSSVPKSGIKTLSPQSRGGITNQQVQRTSSGLRTIPPQRPSKVTNKTNYIGKHAIQAQKFKSPHGIGKPKNLKPPPIPTVNNVFPHRTPQNTGVIYHQALTANILQSLSENNTNSSYNSSSSRSFDYSSKYEGNHNSYNNENRNTNYNDAYIPPPPPPKPQSNLEALSFVCQAVLLDHNYNATPPTELSTRTNVSTNSSVQLNGASVGTYYSPTNSTRNRSSLGGSTNSLCTLSSVSSSSILPSNPSSATLQDDDAASDISCGSERKVETEGEETDTAPEAEAVNNEDSFDHYGDYVTRCICGFLHDDGFMIECDKCKVWQHVRCVIKNNKKVPDDYLCEVCDPTKPVDRGKARSLQQQWMRENQEREAKLRKEARLREMKLKETLSDTDSSDGEQMSGNILNKSRVGTAGRRKSDQGPRQNSRQRRDSNRPDSVLRRNAKRKERKITKKKPKPPPKSDEETQETWPHSSISQLPQLRQWIENYEEAVTNHYSPELRARISSIRINGIHSDLSSQVDNSVHKCRVHTQPLTGLKYLVSTIHLSPNTPVVELRGKYMLSTQHRGNTPGHGGTLTTRQHAQRPGPFLFFYRLHKDNTEVCVDTRTYGNDARFIRRSCKPNAELRHCIEKGVLHLYIVTTGTVEKNLELTIKHESHDLAAVGTTHIACACGRADECSVNKGPLKKNGEATEVSNSSSGGVRKKRGRRTVSSTSEQAQESVPPPPPIIPPHKIKEEIPPSPVEIKQEIEEKVEPEVKPEDIKPVKVKEVKVEPEEEEENDDDDEQDDLIKNIKVEECRPTTPENETIKQEDDTRSPSPPLSISTRKSTYHQKSDSEDKKESVSKDGNATSAADKKKLSREERKIEAYMKAFERMERQQQRKQEHQAKQAHRRESEPGPLLKDEDRSEPRAKRRRRKGRARTVSTNSQARRNRLNSADSSYATSGDECLLSPNENNQGHLSSKDGSADNSPSKDAGLLLALANCENSNRSDMKSPIPDIDCNMKSPNSSPETPLSSACLLVAAAVEPLEPSFKFPKTKKGLMNEWLNKSPECVQSASSISPSSLTPHIPAPPESTFYDSNSNSGFYTSAKNLVSLAQAANYCEIPSQQPHGNAKKRWLRQAISEDQCDSPTDSPPLSDMVAPPKKRRLPRESLSADSPPTTPTSLTAPSTLMGGDESKRFQEQEDRVEIVTAGNDGDSPTQIVMDDATLKERVAEMQQEIGACFRLPPEPRDISQKEGAPSQSLRCVLDPRLARPMFNNSDHLVATVEKNLSILGLEEQKPENVTPIKRKLSITEYRQRKQLSVSEKTVEEPIVEESTSSQSPPHNQKLRTRSDSASSNTSFLSSDDDVTPSDLPTPTKGLSAFNSEPTELEKQRESVSLRLKKAFGLSIDEDSSKTALKMETILNCDLDTSPIKTSLQRYSPTFPIPGTCSNNNNINSNNNSEPVATTPLSEISPADETSSEANETREEDKDHSSTMESQPSPVEQETADTKDKPPLLLFEENESKVEKIEEKLSSSIAEDDKHDDDNDNNNAKVLHAVKPEMYYTPDEEDEKTEEEEATETEVEKSDSYDTVESTNYVPPFNNPVYPNSSFTTFGSVMDDDAPYEGRNPSPPPELSSASGSYSSP